jgi:hypothetical protein
LISGIEHMQLKSACVLGHVVLVERCQVVVGTAAAERPKVDPEVILAEDD